ncbi:unnamed protein product [Prunus armeniaca]
MSTFEFLFLFLALISLFYNQHQELTYFFSKTNHNPLFTKLRFLKENFKQTIPPVKVDDGEEITCEKATASLRRYVHFFSALQASDGHWLAENAGPLFFLPPLFLLLLLGREEEIKMKEKIKKGINSEASFVLATWKLSTRRQSNSYTNKLMKFGSNGQRLRPIILVASGFVIRDSDGHVLLAGAKNIGDNTISVAECMALRDGLAFAIHRGWRNILVEGDLKLIINCVNQEADPPWSICTLIQDIKLLSSFCVALSFNHIYCEANFMANAVANVGHGLNPSKLWEMGLPLNCLVPFFFNLFGPACSRGFCDRTSLNSSEPGTNPVKSPTSH